MGPIGTLFELGEAAQSKSEVEQHPDTIETVVTKDNGKITVKSDSEKSIVQQPIPQPHFSAEKAIEGVPTWLIVFNIILGIFIFINSLRSYYNNKKAR